MKGERRSHLEINLYSIILLFLISCSSENEITTSSNACLIRYDSLYKDIDTSEMEIIRLTEENNIEISDEPIDGQRSLLIFSREGNLKTFYFVKDSFNNSSFKVDYDSLGFPKRSSVGEVVQWGFYKSPKDTIWLTILLSTIDRNYGDLKLRAGSFIDSTLDLKMSYFTKIVCVKTRFSLESLGPNKTIFFSGTRGEKCSKETTSFIDSTISIY